MTSRAAKSPPTATSGAHSQSPVPCHVGRLTASSLGIFQGIRRSLRAKFIIIIISLQIALMSAVAFVMDGRQRQAMMGQTQLRALSLGQSLATLSEAYILSYNFAKLEQAVERLTAHDADVVYTVAHLHDGVIAAYSGRDDLQGTTLHDPVSQRALQANTPLVQEIFITETQEPGYDVAIPVLVPGSTRKWGTIRLGFSLKRAYKMIQQTRGALLLLTLGAIVCGMSLATLLATRISRPVSYLVTAAQELTKGSYDRPVWVEAYDEIGTLAHAFEEMRLALLHHLAGEAAERQRLEERNRQLREAQQQLIQSERLAAIGKIAARVAHEVNNPLAIMKTAVRIIRNQHLPEHPSVSSLQMIEDEISRITRIIQELLEFARPTTPVQEWVQVNAIIHDLAPLLEQDCREKQISVDISLAPELPPICIAADQLKQVVLNIVRNAQDAMPEGGRLIICTVQQERFIELSIADSGHGIPPEHHEHIFDPFFTTKRRGRGVGLGLAISHSIIIAASGHITVESEVGKGSLFRLSLPVVQALERKVHDARIRLDSAHRG